MSDNAKRVIALGADLVQRLRARGAALIQSAEAAPTVGRLVGHARASLTLDTYASAWPDAVAASGEKVAALASA